MDVFDIKGHYGVFVGRCAVELHARDVGHACHGILGEFALVSGYAVHTDAFHIVNGSGQGVTAHIVGRAGLKLIRQPLVGGFFKGDACNHLSAALIGLHLLQKGFTTIEHANACGSIDFVSAEREEVASQGLHIDFEMRHTLCAIGQEVSAMSMSHLGHTGYGVDRAEHIAHMRHTDQTRTRREQLLIGLHIQFAGIVHGDDFNHDALTLSQELPGHDVAMVFHHREQDLVSFLQKRFAEARGHQIKALGGASGEDDFAHALGTDKCSDALAGLLVECGGLLRQEVHIGVDRIIFLGNGLDHGSRLLRRGRIVQIDQGTPIDFTRKNGEVSAYIIDGISHIYNRRYLHKAQSLHFFIAPLKRISTRCERRSRRLSSVTRCNTSPTKACWSSSRASSSGMPRCRI